MLNNFIYSKTKDLFLEQLEAGHVLDEAVTFIEDTKEIWNHGTYFDGTNVREYAFPKTGGLITGVSSYPLQLKSSSDIYSTIRFITNNDDYITFGFKNSDNPQLFFTNKNGWDNEYFLYHSGNFNPSDYLSLSGGTLTDALYMRFDNPRIICYDASGNHLGNIGFYNGVPSVFADNKWNTLLHSGNVGEYALKQGSYFTLEDSINIAGYGGIEGGWTVNGAAMILGYNKDYRWAIQAYSGSLGHHIVTKYCLAGTWTDWKTIAFTDSDITGNAATANKLISNAKIPVVSVTGAIFDFNRDCTTGELFVSSKMGLEIEARESFIEYKGYSTAKRYVGSIILNQSGNVTIGNQDYAGSNDKLFVDGRTSSKGYIFHHLNDTVENKGAFLMQYFSSSSNDLLVLSSRNKDYSAKSNILAVDWAKGNLLVGTTNDNGSGAKLQVAGDITINGISLLEKLTNIEQSSDTLEDYVQENRSKSTEAINTANTAKNAVATLEGLANATTAQITLAATVTQIEQNTTDIKVLQDMYVLMSVAEYEALEIKDSDKIYMLYEE